MAIRRLDGYSGYEYREEYYAVDSMDELKALHAEKKRNETVRFHVGEIEEIECGGKTTDFDGIYETGRTFKGVGFETSEISVFSSRYSYYIVLDNKSNNEQ